MASHGSFSPERRRRNFLRILLAVCAGVTMAGLRLAAETVRAVSRQEEAAWEAAETHYRDVVHHEGVNSRDAVEARKRLDDVSRALEDRYPYQTARPDLRKQQPYPTPEPVHPRAGPAPGGAPNGGASQ